MKGECDPKYFRSPSLLMELFCYSFYDDHHVLSDKAVMLMEDRWKKKK